MGLEGIQTRGIAPRPSRRPPCAKIFPSRLRGTAGPALYGARNHPESGPERGDRRRRALAHGQSRQVRRREVSRSSGIGGRTIPSEPVLSLNREVQKKGKSGEKPFCPLANSKNSASHPPATFSGFTRLRIPLQQPHFDSAAIQ